MKKFLTIGFAAALFLSSMISASAQVQWGVIGGASFPTTKAKELKNTKVNGWNAGFTLKLGLPAGFSIQPSLVYSNNMSKVFTVDGETGDPIVDENGVRATEKYSQGSLVLPVSFQWGPDLLIFRPFVDVTPFVGYALINKKADQKNAWDDLNRLNYGVGVGVGFDIWRLQIIARYNWNLGTFAEKKSAKDAFKSINKNNLNGITLTAAVLFGGGNKKNK